MVLLLIVMDRRVHSVPAPKDFLETCVKYVSLNVLTSVFMSVVSYLSILFKLKNEVWNMSSFDFTCTLRIWADLK